VLPILAFLEVKTMKKIRMCFPTGKTFEEGFEEYILDCKARNLRNGTINHYRDSIKQIYKRIPPNTPISSFCQQTMTDFYIALRDDPALNEISMGTYARDLKTLMRFFMKCEYLPRFEIPLPKADKAPIQTCTDEELKKLLKKPDVRKCIFSTYRSWVIVNFLLSTGVRQNSLVNIKIRDVDFDNSVVYVNTTKNCKPLIIPLNEDFV
jgi:integrase/recombinase XerD